jgi:Ca2+-binding EF-hand superfamily protein
MSVSELYDILCKDNSTRKEYIEAVLDELDQDQSDTISFHELIHVFLKNLGDAIVDISYQEVRE